MPCLSAPALGSHPTKNAPSPSRGNEALVVSLSQVIPALAKSIGSAGRLENPLAACFSRELADYTIQVIDVAGGDKIPRKGGPGITQTDLLVINKTDLAEAVGADLKVMERDTKKMRGNGPFVFAQVKHGVGVDEIISRVLHTWQHAIGVAHGH